MIEEYKQEILNIIVENNWSDIYTYENDFYNKYKVNLYTYIRVSTEKQEFSRQLYEIYRWAKKNNITIYINNIYCDKYTGKKLNRKAYLKLKENVKQNDYILITEISRLGRNWDAIKTEWYQLKVDDINILVSDFEMLSSALPNEKSENMTVDKKFIQELVFLGILYSACKKIEEVSTSTKNGLKVAKMQGKIIGRPSGKYTNKENFIKTLKLHVEGLSIDKAVKTTCFPRSTFKYWLKEYKKEVDIYNDKKILELLEKGEI